MVRHKSVIRAAILAVILSVVPAVGMEPPEVITHVGYGGFFRAPGWAPVDVYVVDKGDGVRGRVTLRCGRQNYESPLDLPAGGRQRVRFHAYLEQDPSEAAVELAVQVYDGANALCHPVPTVMLTPVSVRDRLVLVLDDHPSGYVFLGPALGKDAKGAVVFREQLRSDNLERLAEYPQCLYPFDAIVLGDVDISRLTERQAESLRLYASLGGTLILTTGAHARRYKGTWVEQFSGAALGDPIALPPTSSEVICPIAPADSTSQLAGAGAAAAITCTRGAGRVTTFAGDVHTGAASGVAAGLSRAIAEARSMPLGASVAGDSIPEWLEECVFEPGHLARRDLLVYCIVLVVGGLGTALVKGPRYAWLVIFVLTCAALARVWYRGNDIAGNPWAVCPVQQLFLRDGAASVQVTAYVQVSTTRPRRFVGTKTGGYSLVRNAGGHAAVTNREHAKFEVTFDDSYSVSVLAFDDVVQAGGGFDGVLSIDEEGRLGGTLVNHTGLPLAAARVIHEGAGYDAAIVDTRLTIGAGIGGMPDSRTRSVAEAAPEELLEAYADGVLHRMPKDNGGTVLVAAGGGARLPATFENADYAYCGGTVLIADLPVASPGP